MQLEGHSHSGRHDSIQQVHICKDPLVSWRCDAKVSLEEGVEAVEERLQAAKTRAGYEQ